MLLCKHHGCATDFKQYKLLPQRIFTSQNGNCFNNLPSVIWKLSDSTFQVQPLTSYSLASKFLPSQQEATPLYPEIQYPHAHECLVWKWWYPHKHSDGQYIELLFSALLMTLKLKIYTYSVTSINHIRHFVWQQSLTLNMKNPSWFTAQNLRLLGTG